MSGTRITEATVNWTRESQPGAFPARYRASRGPWRWQITDRRKTGASLKAYRGGVLVLDTTAPTLREAKDTAYGMLSAAERMAWFRRGGNEHETSYARQIFRAVPDDGGYRILCRRGGQTHTGPLAPTLAAAKRTVADLIDQQFPPKVWTPVTALPDAAGGGYCDHCEHCNE